MQGLEGNVAIITGGASGIGAGLVPAFVNNGIKVVFCDIQTELGEEIGRKVGPNCAFIPADIRNDEDIERLVGETKKRFGRIDFLINVAATYSDDGLETDRATWLNGLNTNLVSHVMLMQAALDELKKSPNPRIVNFTSEAARVGLSGRWVYPTSKAAIEQVTRSMALDLAPFGINVNSVMPGLTAKPWHLTTTKDIADYYDKMAGRMHIIERMGTIEEVADAVLFLCSKHASFMTGSCMHVDGGHNALGPQGKERHLPTKSRKEAGVAFQADID